ncbi:MAG TPA: hypothetical protein VIU11_14545 [Nakamurella sp.]
MSNASEFVAVRLSDPDKPVFDCQLTFHVVVAVTGHLPVPSVRTLSERHLNMWPQGGSAFQSYPGGGGVPAPVQVTVTGGPGRYPLSVLAGSPSDHVVDVKVAFAVTETPLKVTVTEAGGASSTQSQVQS